MSIELTSLNPEQKKAVEEINGPCMIIAGAGSGKTRVLTYKIAYLIDKGINPVNILALTFTNKAADEMKERVIQLCSNSVNHLWIGTFHSMFARILRNEGEYIGFSRYFSIYDTTDSTNFIKAIMDSHNISTEKFNPKSIQGTISNLKNKLIYPEIFSTMAQTFYEKKVDAVYRDYQAGLLKNNSMDFDDLLLKPIELFGKFPEILDKYQERFKYILVDEYQDTNRAQYEVLRMLALKYKNISVVGDDAQSIYKWRGAEIQNIFDFETEYKDVKIFRLEQNYRSTKKILNLADDVIKNNKRRIEKKLWTDNIKGEDIILIENSTDREESDRIAKYIQNEIHNKKINFKDFAILYRTNAQSRTIEDSMRQYNLPCIIIGGIRFYQRKEIKDILAYLKIIINESDNESMMRILLLCEGIGKTTIDKLLNKSEKENKSIFDCLKLLDKTDDFSQRIRNKLIELLNFIFKYKYLKDEMSVSELVRGVIDEIGIIKNLKQDETVESEERINNINELLSAVAEYDDTNDKSNLTGFLEKVSLVSDIDELDNKKNAVTLMTLHSAKGLEFPVVFITGMEEGLFPVSVSLDKEDDIEEERRLFYVGITRSIKKLYITFSNLRYRFGNPSYQMKSRFIKEISPDVFSENIKFHIYDKFKGHEKKDIILGMYGKQKSIKKFSKKREIEDEGIIDDKFPEIRKGVNIFHNTFGNGKVISTSGKGLEKKAEIYFDEVGMKKIILRFAKFRVV
jgi:DNA helicase-2/ATP-dependent DNA helicase PcrA